MWTHTFVIGAFKTMWMFSPQRCLLEYKSDSLHFIILYFNLMVCQKYIDNNDIVINSNPANETQSQCSTAFCKMIKHLLPGVSLEAAFMVLSELLGAILQFGMHIIHHTLFQLYIII